jgi:hypothetical protein
MNETNKHKRTRDFIANKESRHGEVILGYMRALEAAYNTPRETGELSEELDDAILNLVSLLPGAKQNWGQK